MKSVLIIDEYSELIDLLKTMGWIDIVIGLLVLVLGLCYWLTPSIDFWKSRGVVALRPLPVVGTLKDVFIGKISLAEYLMRLYNEYCDERMIGIFIRLEPTLILRDLDLVKDVLIKDFAKFPDRGLKTFDKAEPLSQHLINLEPARWRPLRTKLTPVFTSTKMKKMFYLLLECGGYLEEYLNKIVDTKEPVECCELTAKFTTDVIGNCVFGIQTNTLSGEDCEFRKMGIAVRRSNWKNVITTRIRNYAPWLYSRLGVIITDWKMTNFFLNVMRDTVEYRKKNGIVKYDFVDLIMEMRDNPDKVADIELTDILLSAQLFVFFIAGYETSATTMSNALYELAQNQTIQNRVRNEINNELTKSNGELTYDGIRSMTYLNMVYQETLRKYPVSPVLFRKCTDEYTFASSKVTIPKGTRIVVPIFAIQRDPLIYPKPEEFDPERFTKEAVDSRHPMSWLPFGDGPRNCIGARFANYQTKVGLIKILQHYKIDICDKTQIPIIWDPKNISLATLHGIHLKISKID